jgi:hypothetical protein
LDLIEQLTRHPRIPMKIIATTSVYPAPELAKVIDFGVDAVVPETVSPEKWRITVAAVLRKAKPAWASSKGSDVENLK